VFKDILVAIDDTDQANAALDLAIELARALGSELTLVHALDPGRIAASAGDVGAGAALEIELDELEAAGKELMASAVERVKAAGLGVTPIVRDGVPAATIVDTARRSGCDLIVIGTHGRGGVARLFLGSTAEAVLRESPIPVVVKRS